MIRSIVFAVALMFGLSASPGSNHTKEISPTLIDIVYAAEPCPPVLVTVRQDAPAPQVEVKVKKKKRPTLKAKQKKKHHAAAHHHQQKKKTTHHHNSHAPGHHHNSIPSSHSSSHGPLHLTSPPGCG